MLGDYFPGLFQSCRLVDVDANDGKRSAFVFLESFLNLGELGDAGLAPGGPEVKEQELAPVFAEPEIPAGCICQFHIRSGFAERSRGQRAFNEIDPAAVFREVLDLIQAVLDLD